MIARTLATQHKLVLSGLLLQSLAWHKTYTGEAYQAYHRLCDTESVRPLTQRHFPDMAGFPDIYGLISVRVIS